MEKERVYNLGELLLQNEPVALDFETTDFDSNEAVCFSLAGVYGNKIHYGVWPACDLDELIKYLPKNRIVFHNLKFDGKVLVKAGFDLSKIQYEDTMIMAKMLDEESKVGLKDLADKELGMQMAGFSGELRDEYMNTGSSIEFEKYAADDAIATIKLFHLFRPQILKEALVTAYMIELKTTIPLMYMELNGFSFSHEKCDELFELVKEQIIEVEDSIYESASRQVALTVPTDLAGFLFDDLEIPYKSSYSEGMKTKARSVKASVLETLVQDLEGDPRQQVVLDIIKWKKFNKLVTSFFSGQKQASAKHADGRVRGSVNAVVAVTGRFSGADPNLMQLPATPIVGNDYDTSIRAMYIPAEGNVLIDADFSQIELRLLAHFSKDPTLIKGFHEGLDYHQLTVDMTGGKISRRAAKIANFGMLYGMSVSGFAKQAKISHSEAVAYYTQYANSFPGVEELKESVIKSVTINGYVRTLGGRKRRMDKGMDEYLIQRTFVNYLIQGGAAVLLKLALIKLFEEFKNKECKILYPVHDELIFECPAEKGDYYSGRIKEIMENCIPLRVPIVVDPKICKHFGEAKDD